MPSSEQLHDSPSSQTPSPSSGMAVIHIVFFCKDCEKIVSGIKVGNKYVYKCSLCGTKNVAFGTEKSIRSFYRVKEENIERQS